MKLFLFCSFLLSPVIATSFGSNSAVITSQDVHDGVTASNLTPGGRYRVYGVYASTVTNADIPKKILIKGADNTQFNLADLATPKPGTEYVLDNAKELTAPITIVDTNPNPDTGFPAFSLYFVSTTVPVAPVLSAQLVERTVDSSVAKISSAYCTILSAEVSILLSNIDTSTINVEVRNVGYDVVSPDYTVMTATRKSDGTSVMISGPIMTVHNPNGQPANFKLSVLNDGTWSSVLISPGDSTTLLSNGFLEVGESYNSIYLNQEARSRNYDFGRDTEVTFNPVVGNYYPNKGDSVKFSCTKADGKTTVYDCGELAGSVKTDTCKSISLRVLTQGVLGPRFKVEIETQSASSGDSSSTVSQGLSTTSGAFSSSLLVLLMVSFLGVISR